MMAFEYFLLINRTALMVNCLRSGINTPSSRRLVQAVTDFGCSLRFPHKNFIASFRIVLRRKVAPLKTSGCISGSKQKTQGKRPPGNSLQSYLFLLTKLSFGKTVVHFNFSHLSGGLWMMNFTVFDQ